MPSGTSKSVEQKCSSVGGALSVHYGAEAAGPHLVERGLVVVDEAEAPAVHCSEVDWIARAVVATDAGGRVVSPRGLHGVVGEAEPGRSGVETESAEKEDESKESEHCDGWEGLARSESWNVNSIETVMSVRLVTTPAGLDG